MINSNVSLEKNKIYKEQKESVGVVSIMPKKQKKNEKTRNLNLCIAIDISGSMNGSISVEDFAGVKNNLNPFGSGESLKNKKSKLNLAKKAAQNLIDNLSSGDCISVLAFDGDVDVVIQPTFIEKNKEELKGKVERLKTRGMTNIHKAWLESTKKVAENFKSENINRILLLTDGRITVGERNMDKICGDISKIREKNISLTCFGVGPDFAEELMRYMSDSGDGNFYYIDEEDKFDEIFSQELSGIDRIVGDTVIIEVEDNIYIKNDFKVVDNKVMLPNLVDEKEIVIFFEIKNLENIKNNKIKIGNLKYSDNGKIKNKVIEKNIEVVSKKDWEALPYNDQVKTQQILMDIVSIKKQVISDIDNENINDAKEKLNIALRDLNSLDIVDYRIEAEKRNIKQTITDYESNKNLRSIRKDVYSQQYMASTSRL